MDLFSLKGKTALVTGAAGGLGTAVSHALGAHGAQLVVTDIRDDAVRELGNAIVGQGGQCLAARCDVTRPEDIEAIVRLAVEAHGGIDVLVHVAGQAVLRPLLEMSIEEFDSTMDCILKAAFRMTQAVGRVMVDGGRGGSVIHISSIAGTRALGRGTGAYASAKAGINALVREAAIEWAPHRIRVNGIAPCQFRTASLESVLDDRALGTREALLEKMLSKIPLGRLGEPADIAGPAVFLASDASAMVTGHILYVDGGYTAQ